MSKRILLRIHRWITLVFAVPLAVLILTGLVLSFEPIVATTAISPGIVTQRALDDALAQHDPQGRAKTLVLRSYDGPGGAMTVSGTGGGPRTIDLATGREKAAPGLLAETFQTARRLHHRLVYDLEHVVTASTIALLVLIAIGVAMARFDITATVSGWHIGTGWITLPLIVASPLTGLLMAFGVTFAPSDPPGRATPPLPMREVVRIVAQAHDPAAIVWVRTRGRAQLVRLIENGEYRVHRVQPDGLADLPRNWPRLLHEGTWGAVWPGVGNALISVALLGLLGTGLVIWARKRIAKRRAGLLEAHA